MKTEDAWEIWGREEPYFAVLTDEKFLYGNLTDERLDAFFDTGRGHVRRTLTKISVLTGREFSPRSALDFGCGTGRLLVALAEESTSVTGVDIARSMLAEARRNCDTRAAGADVRLMTTSEFLAESGRSYDFIHSHLVFQHIRRSDGEPLLRALAERLQNDGVLAVSVLCGNRHAWPRRLAAWMEARFALVHAFVRHVKREPHRIAAMEMNIYDVGQISASWANAGVRVLDVATYEEGALRWATLFGCRERDATV